MVGLYYITLLKLYLNSRYQLFLHNRIPLRLNYSKQRLTSINSGAIHKGVPTVVYVDYLFTVNYVANPKSASFIYPFSLINKFSALISRCI